MLSIYVDPSQLAEPTEFHQEVSRYIDFVKSSRPSSPDGEVLVPGDPEASNLEQRLAEGIELDDATWNQILEAARDQNVDSDLIAAVDIPVGGKTQ